MDSKWRNTDTQSVPLVPLLFAKTLQVRGSPKNVSPRKLREREGRVPGRSWQSNVLTWTLRCIKVSPFICVCLCLHCNISWCQCANVDMEVRVLPLQLSPVVEFASPLPSAGSSRLRSLVLSWMIHWSQSSGSSSIRKPRQMMNTAMRRTVLKLISHV